MNMPVADAARPEEKCRATVMRSIRHRVQHPRAVSLRIVAPEGDDGYGFPTIYWSALNKVATKLGDIR